MEEIWKEIPGFPDYKISNLGKVESFRVKYKTRKFLKPGITPDGYLRVHLKLRDNSDSVSLLHRLLAITFIPNPDNLSQVNHKDSNKLNNSLDNLEWVSQRENITHRFKNTKKSKYLCGCF